MKEALQRLISLALKQNASDIHLTLENNQCKVEIRKEGILTLLNVDNELKKVELFHYLKYVSHCELSNMATPQTGSFDIQVDGKNISCRFALLQTRYRQAGVIRLLNHGTFIDYRKLSPDPKIIATYQHIIQLKNGFVLIAGVTGSGKTTTAYSLLNAMHSRKIYTIEDPIEIYYPTLMQVQVNESAQMDYANAIKQIMRHDPDVIFLGEIRDEKAAQMALRCALTGHLVIATIHASSVIGAIYRMLDLNVDSSQLYEMLDTITCQVLLNETSSHVKFNAVETLNKQQIQAFKCNQPIHYEKLETIIQRYSYQKSITY